MKQRKFTILMSILVLLIISVLSTTTAFSQCKYVSVDKGKAITTIIPSDFPVQINTGNPDADKVNFEKAVADWKTLHPDLSDLDMTPPQSSGRFIQIPQEEMNNFSPEKRDAILMNRSFYQVTQ